MANRLSYVLVIGLLTIGCRSADEPTATATAMPEAIAAETDTTASLPLLSESPPVPDSAAPVVAEFDPPFPSRNELFAPPRRGPATIRRDDEHGGTIELKGFVDVNGPQAVLSIDGVLSPIPVGGEKYGVQVISIKPPQAVLQRGRNRWTASVE